MMMMLSCIVGNLNARFKKDKEYMEKKAKISGSAVSIFC